MRLIGTILLAGGLLLVSMIAGFVVAMVAAVTLATLLPGVADEDTVLEIARAAIVYVVWGVTATAVFAMTWRRLRAS